MVQVRAPAIGRGTNTAGASAPAAEKQPEPKRTLTATNFEAPPTGHLFGGLRRTLSDQLGSTKKKAPAGPPITPERKKALTTVRNMLEPNKLGGADRTFNFGDIDAVVAGMMKDKQGLKREVQADLRAKGKDWEADQVGPALDGKWGVTYAIARSRINKEAPAKIKAQMAQGLREGNIDPKTANTADPQPRNVTFDEMRAFQDASGVLRAMQKDVAAKLGYEVTLPNGVSQAAIDFMLSGQAGVPPGAKVVPKE